MYSSNQVFLPDTLGDDPRKHSCPKKYWLWNIRSLENKAAGKREYLQSIIIRKRLNGGTVPPFKLHPGGTVPPFKMHPGGTVPPFKMHSGGTVPPFEMHLEGTVPPFKRYT